MPTCRSQGGKPLRETYGSNTLDFFYDQSGYPYALKYNGTLYYYITNLQGDVLHLTNANGTVVVNYTYDPYGKPLDTTGTMATTVGAANPLRYRGYYYDAETGFYYLQSRYYDPSTCRFVSADSTINLGVNGDFVGYNLFAYCGNLPISRSDHSGKFWDTIFDVVSVCFSVADVIANPSDPWAWAGLVGDVVDLVPFVSGAGEIIKAAKTVDKALDAADAIHDTAKVVENTTEAASRLHRPYIRKSTREAVENAAARAPDGRFLDANTGLVIEGKYDLGHTYGHEFWRERQMAEAKGWTQKQFNDYMNNPDFYRIEDPASNRSHKFEKKD